MQPLVIPDAYAWSRRNAERSLNFNGHLFVRPEGNVAVDPVALEDDELERVTALGGISTIVVTNRDHVRATADLRERFGARVATSQGEASALGIPVDRVLADGEEAFSGAAVVTLEHQKSPGEFALHLRAHHTVLVGDALIGAPAGALSMLDDVKYSDPTRAALSLRRLWALLPQALLVGDGSSLFSGATEQIATLLFARLGIAANRINLNELRYESSDAVGGKYRSDDAEVGQWIGARDLGYQVVKLPPGARFCPVHAEYGEEELFFVLDGTPSIRTTSETMRCRRGDFIAFPTGPQHAHQVLNESAHEATILLLGQNSKQMVVHYPESNKVLFSAPNVRWMVRNEPQLDYWDGE